MAFTLNSLMKIPRTRIATRFLDWPFFSSTKVNIFAGISKYLMKNLSYLTATDPGMRIFYLLMKGTNRVSLFLLNCDALDS